MEKIGQLVYENGVYQTRPTPPSPLARRLPSLIFYAKFITIIWKASIKGKHGRYASPQWIQSGTDVIHALESIGVRLTIRGVEHLREFDGPCVIVSNHMSMLETTILPAIVPPLKEATFVVKESLLTYPVFGHVMKAFNPIPVTRANVRHDFKLMMEGGLERLQAGISLIIFPQTTRTLHFDPAEFNSIGVKLAKRANVPLVPLALISDAWQNGRMLKDFGKLDASREVKLCFGKPLRVNGRGDEEHQQVIDLIQQFLLKERGAEIMPIDRNA